MWENVKVQLIVCTSLMKIVANLKMRLEDVSKLLMETSEYLNKIKLKDTLKRGKNVSEMKNVFTTKSWADTCRSDVVFCLSCIQ